MSLPWHGGMSNPPAAGIGVGGGGEGCRWVYFESQSVAPLARCKAQKLGRNIFLKGQGNAHMLV